MSGVKGVGVAELVIWEWPVVVTDEDAELVIGAFDGVVAAERMLVNTPYGTPFWLPGATVVSVMVAVSAIPLLAGLPLVIVFHDKQKEVW